MDSDGGPLAPAVLVALVGGELDLAELAGGAESDCVLHVCTWEANSHSSESSSFVCSTCTADTVDDNIWIGIIGTTGSYDGTYGVPIAVVHSSHGLLIKM